MPFTVYKFIDNLSNLEGFNGVKVKDIPGGAGIGPQFVTIFWYAVGLVPLSTGTLLGYPGNPIGVDDGPVDASGILAASRALLYDEATGTYNQVAGGAVPFPDGFWNTVIRVECDRGDEGTRQIQLELSVLDPTDAGDFPDAPPPPNVPNTPTVALIPGDEGLVDVGVTSNTALIADETGISIERRKTDGSNTWETIASIPSSAAPSWPIYPTFRDNLTTNGQFIEPIPGLYRYRARAYKWTAIFRSVTAPSPESPEIDFEDDGPTPTLEYTMSGGLDLGGSPSIVFIVDPSGIYTLVKDKTNDTLYNRAGDTSVTVKIPDPFIKTGYLP